jgi:hypothetical protein
MKNGIELITEEREKQVNKYNHTAASDSIYKDKELLRASMTYLMLALTQSTDGKQYWPWHPDWLHNEGYIENLKKAGAFIAAELDRVQLN